MSAQQEADFRAGGRIARGFVQVRSPCDAKRHVRSTHIIAGSRHKLPILPGIEAFSEHSFAVTTCHTPDGAKLQALVQRCIGLWADAATTTRKEAAHQCLRNGVVAK